MPNAKVKQEKPVIDEIKIKKIFDMYPDLSYLGEFTDTWKPGAIDLKETGDWKPGNYQYFVSCNHGEFNPENWKHVSEKDKKKVIAEFGSLEKAEEHYAKEDFKRMMQYERGEIVNIGIRAECTVKYKIPYNPGSWRLETFTSSGLWGIESDSTEEYIREIAEEQISDLKEHLKQFNVNLRNFKKLSEEQLEILPDIEITE